MADKFAVGKQAFGFCDRCSFRFKLSELRKLTIKTKQVSIKVCKSCWEPDQPQLQLGMYPVFDPQALRDPRPDTSYVTSGLGADGEQSGGSRVYQWGWAPVGGAQAQDVGLTPNYLVAISQVGSATVSVT